VNTVKIGTELATNQPTNISCLGKEIVEEKVTELPISYRQWIETFG